MDEILPGWKYSFRSAGFKRHRLFEEAFYHGIRAASEILPR
jgi:hypothetical protein